MEAQLVSDAVTSKCTLDTRIPNIQLAKRAAKRAKAEEDLKNATEAEEKSDVDKFSKRLVRVTREHNEDCKTLLRLMGVPVVDVSVVRVGSLCCHESHSSYSPCCGRGATPWGNTGAWITGYELFPHLRTSGATGRPVHLG